MSIEKSCQCLQRKVENTKIILQYLILMAFGGTKLETYPSSSIIFQTSISHNVIMHRKITLNLLTWNFGLDGLESPASSAANLSNLKTKVDHTKKVYDQKLDIQVSFFYLFLLLSLYLPFLTFSQAFFCIHFFFSEYFLHVFVQIEEKYPDLFVFFTLMHCLYKTMRLFRITLYILLKLCRVLHTYSV